MFFPTTTIKRHDAHLNNYSNPKSNLKSSHRIKTVEVNGACRKQKYAFEKTMRKAKQIRSTKRNEELWGLYVKEKSPPCPAIVIGR